MLNPKDEILPGKPKLLRLVHFPDKSLEIPSKPVPEDKKDDIQMLARLMRNAMSFYGGMGLSAVQVGVHYQIFLMKRTNGEVSTFINPEILFKSDDLIEEDEGCLSFPTVFVPIKRTRFVKLKYLDENFVEKVEDFENLEARCVDHEMEHLEGKVFLNKMTKLRRGMIEKKMKKRKGLI